MQSTATSLLAPAFQETTPAVSGCPICQSRSQLCGQWRSARQATRSFAVFVPGRPPAAAAVPARTASVSRIRAPRRTADDDIPGRAMRPAALVLVLLVLAGCGGTPSARDRYVSALNALCDDFQQREREIGAPHSIEELAAKGPRIVEAFDRAIADRIGDLEPPPELAADADKLETLARKQHDALAGLAAAAQTRQLGALDRLSRENLRLNAESGAVARRLGAKRCSGG